MLWFHDVWVPSEEINEKPIKPRSSLQCLFDSLKMSNCLTAELKTDEQEEEEGQYMVKTKYLECLYEALCGSFIRS